MILLQPFQEDAGVMQRDPYLWMLLEYFDERLVRMVIGVLKDEVEVSDRLMIVNGEKKSYSFQLGTIAILSSF